MAERFLLVFFCLFCKAKPGFFFLRLTAADSVLFCFQHKILKKPNIQCKIIFMTFTLNFALLFVVALTVSALGFIKYVYFISLGYGFSIAAQGIFMLFAFRHRLNVWVIIPCVLLIVYGLRLSLFLLIRELKSSAYNSVMKKEIKQNEDVSFGVKIAIWITCVLLYGCQVAPVFFRLQNILLAQNAELTGGAVFTAGMIVAFAGLILESAADIQKNHYKKINPKRFCDKGLFKIVRCPNYLGEVLFWTGVFVSGANAINGAAQWIIVVSGYLGIIYVMFSGARRLEIRQNKNYGTDPDYAEYVKRTPILLPFIPLYSVEKYKWLVG